MSLKKYFLFIITILLFNLGFAGDFYWVGNSGNWNDATHWSNTSGGVGNFGVPSIDDNVFIDENSFKKRGELVINGDAFCHDFSWTTKKESTLKSNINTSLNISGSFTLNEKFLNEFYGKTIFSSKHETKQINTKGIEFLGDVEFNGVGTWDFLANFLLTDSNYIFLNGGNLLFNNITIYSGGIITGGSFNKKITLNNSVLYLHDRVLLDAPNFSLLNIKSDFILSRKASAINLGNIDEKSVIMSNGTSKGNCDGSSPSMTLTTTVITDYNGYGVSCFEACDAIIVVSISGGVGPFDIVWDGNAGTDTLYDACQGGHGVQVTDLGQNPPFGFQCTDQVTVTNPNKLVINLLGVIEPTCKGDCDGTIATGVAFGTSPYTISWVQTTDTTSTITDVCAGSYDMDVVDANGCTANKSFVLDEPNVIAFQLDSTNIDCFGNCDGTATISNITGGNGTPYTISWLPNGESTTSITNLCEGTYSVTVSDSKNCSFKDSVQITIPNQLQFNATTQNVSCGGLCDGEITATVTGGGVPPFTHYWSTGTIDVGASSTIDALCFGTYTDSIVDANGCDTVFTFTIIEPTPLITSTNFSDVTCFNACDGIAVTNTSGGNIPYTYNWSSTPAGQVSTGQGTDSISGLCPGQYIVDITDLKNCTVSDTITITEPDLLVVNPSSTDISCPGFCNGTADATPTGGTTPYTYDWSTVPPQNTPGVNSLCPGTYYITITDSNLCVSIDSVVIVEPIPMVLTMNSTDMSCNGVCDGTADVGVVGGVTPYTYVWVSVPAGPIPTGQGTNAISDLCAGTYTVTVTDSNNCTINDNTVVIEPNPITVNLTTVNLTCNGVCNGSASVAPAGGNPPYTVSWDGVLPFTSATSISGLCAGAHTVDVRDNNGCIETINFNIDEPPLLTTSTSGTDLLCNSVCSGTATTNPSGGSGNYDYSWSGPGAPFPNSPSLASLCAGTYIVTITDDSLCTVVDSVVIAEPVPVDANAQFTNMSCNGICDGTAISLPLGGTAPYTFSWSPGGSSQSLSGLCAGQYVVTVTDSNNCVDADTVVVVNPPLLTVNAVSLNASCGAICDGEAIANPSGGTLPYNYTWSTGDTTQNALNLCAGTYGVTVTDSNNCSVVDSVTINNLIVINIVTDTVGISCNGVCDGQATANPSGGTSPYQFSWNTVPPQNTQTATGLCPGTYTVTVTDTNGCASSTTVDMPIDPSVLVPNGVATNVSCNGDCDGTLSSAPTGGVPPYTIVWSVADTNNVCPGTYTVTVTDANNCSQTDTLTVNEPDSITANPIISQVKCNGSCNGSITLNASGGTGTLSYLWAHDSSTNPDVTGLCAGNYSVTVTDSTNCSRIFNFTISEPSVLTATPLSTDVSCFGGNDGTASILVGGGTTPYTYFWSPGGQNTDTIFGLSPNTYTVTITDSNNCIINQNVVVGEPDQLLANMTGTTIACNGNCDGTAVATPTGGTSPYNYNWTFNGAPTPSIGSLCVGTYTVEITDDNGCIITDSYDVTSPPMLVVTLDSTNITCNANDDGTGTVTPIGGTPPYTYLWMPTGQTTANATNLSPGIHTVTVTDSLGCFFTGSINIQEPAIIDANEVPTGANCGFNDGSIITNPTGGTPPYSHSWSTGDTTSGIFGLGVGFYTDTITDFNGCSQIFTIAISNPTGPSGVTTTVNDASCFGACDGNANVIPIGGTPTYDYLWSPGGQVDSTITGQCAGTYNLTITDNLNCVLNTFVVIGEADSISANLLTTNTSCNSSCDGTASVTPSGGTAPYTYLWSNGSTSSSTSGLCAGSASVTITDNNGCSKVITFDITSPNTLSLATTFTDALCNASCDGTATAIPTDGTAPYTYQWNDGLSQTTPVATGLCAGSYDVIVTDKNGCTTNGNIVIAEPSLISPNDVVTDATCGANDGSATVSPTGGTAGYTYVWSNGPTTPTVNGLSAGTYTVEITDANNCMQSFPIAISNVNGPTINTTQNNASCNGVCDGDASVAVVSGVPNYTYLWTPGNQTTTSITGLCAGNYTVEVTDGLGCITTEAVTITDNSLITAAVTTIDATCNGSCNGSALVVPSGGVPPYQYNWSSGHTTNGVGGLCAGNYSVTITDALGCSITENINIGESNLLALTPTVIDANCNGGCDGKASIATVGGTAPYTYLWSNGATTPNIVGLCAGSYDVTVTDVNGCSGTRTLTVGEGTLITATVTSNDATCGVCDGDATVTPIGGSGAPYDVLWLPTGQNTTNATNLCPGAYSVEITDNVGCTETVNVLISNPNGPDITADSDSVSCFGSCDGNAWVTINSGTAPYIYQWDDNLLQSTDSANNLCGGLYNIVVQDANGCISVDSTTVFEPQEILANITSTPINCIGNTDGTATANPTGGIGVYQYSWNTIPVQTTQTATGLAAGTYGVTITDDNNCSIIDSVTITSPTLIDITISATSATCNGDCDGTALATASGGTPPYLYSWDDALNQQNSLAAGLCSNLYTVTVTDDNGCTATDTVTVPNPTTLSTTSTPSPINCSGNCDGSITANPLGGVSPYTYVWSDGQTTQTATGLCAGTYNVVVIDANNCSVSDTIILTDPTAINDSTIVNGPTCGLCDGDATANPVGGVGPYTYLWGDGQTTQTAVGLCAAIITLEITDQGTGCVYDFNIIVNNSTGPNTAMTFTDETCTSSCNGTATVSASGGLAPYTYSWNTSPAQTDSTATGLCTGSYNVTVEDAQGCISIDTVTIGTNGLNLSITNIIPESCYENCDGEATVVVGSGTSPFVYQWTPTGQNTVTATGLCVGTYIVTVTDNLICSDSISTNITGPDSIGVTIITNTPIGCNGVCDGQVTASVTGGSLPYTYTWDNGETTPTISNLCAGTYTVTITDNNGCTNTASVTLTEPNPIVANESLVLPSCNQCNGSITLAPSGGIGPYSFNWSNGQSTNPITNLCAGAYTVTITDNATGCSVVTPIALSNSNAPDANVTATPISCNSVCDGELTSTPTGGTAPYNYLWNPTGQTTPTATGLCVGVYTLEVTDDVGCIGVSIDTLVEPQPFDANIVSDNISCNGLCDGWAAVNPIGGTTPYQTAVWTPGNTAIDSITNLCAGTYFVSVADANGCNATDSVVITEPTAITISSTSVDVTCSSNCDGSANVISTGGVGPYTYSWMPGGQTTANPSDLCLGLNTVTVTDQNGCTMDEIITTAATDTIDAQTEADFNACMGTPFYLNGIATGNVTNVEWFVLPGMVSIGTTDTVTINPTATGTTQYVFEASGACNDFDTIAVTIEDLPIIDAGLDVTIVEETSTVLNATGGITYVWTPSTGLNDSTISNPTATPLVTTTYYVTGTNASGCMATDSVTVTVIPTIQFPDGITPNGDGKNDTWVIDYIQEYPDAVVEIYNRWGELLFHSDDYQNDWDGTYNGENLPVGTYYYIIDLHDDKTEPFTGPLTVLR
ncbi:MAG: gliding motility-associated C-terminal domain-containing protein [Flavobacteriales bacterium]|nr:gliding motility-associated C-terminal domain-containing protein [Flavobacteriales bacterium]